jgi:hypothetical protein
MMPAPSPTDYNTYIDPLPLSVESVGYPRMMYHPTNLPQVVNTSAQEAALIASDAAWTEIDSTATT